MSDSDSKQLKFMAVLLLPLHTALDYDSSPDHVAVTFNDRLV